MRRQQRDREQRVLRHRRSGDTNRESVSVADTDANIPQSNTVQNNVVEGYGRTIPAAFGIGQGEGHDNLYTHNDVYDGYHCAISTSQGIADFDCTRAVWVMPTTSSPSITSVTYYRGL